jgi:hypothetical protein
MTRAAAFAHPLTAGLAAGLLAGVVTLGTALLAGGDGRSADYAGLAAGLLGVHLGMRAAPAASAFRARLVRALVLAVCASLVAGLASAWLYASLRPALLEARYAGVVERVRSSAQPPARIAAELARLAERRAAYLDPAFQAVSAGGTLFFFALLLGGYSAFRAHVAARLRARPSAGAP